MPTHEEASLALFEQILEQAMAAVTLEIAVDPSNPVVTDNEIEAARAGAAVGIALAVARLNTEGWINVPKMFGDLGVTP